MEVWTEERRKLYHSFQYSTGNIGRARRPGEIIVLLETWVLSSSSSSVLLRSRMFRASPSIGLVRNLGWL